MNPFKSFQPEKRREIGPSSNGRGSDTVDQPALKMGSVRSLLAQLNDNPFDLSIVSSELKVSSAEQSAVQIQRPLTCSSTMELKDIRTESRGLLRQITIEANFDIKPLLKSTLNKALTPCYVYPACQREIDPYRIAEYVAAQLSKTRHWSTRATELPYLGTGDTSIVSKTGPNLGLMTGVSKSAAQSSNNRGIPMEGEAALTSMQSHLLKWQEALHALLGQLLAYSVAVSNGEKKLPYFYVLGRSVLLPSHARLQNGPGGRLPLPYTSALFYVTDAAISHGNTTAPMQASSTVSSGTHQKPEPACMLLGVYKPFLLRLQQLGVAWALVEDINSPVPLSKAEASNRGKSAAISIASNKASVDPHASTAALFNSRKLGVDILVRGRYAVTVVAQVLSEGVFDALQVTRASPTDVPVLFAEACFAHAVRLQCDTHPLQCQYDFNINEPDSALQSSAGLAAQNLRSDGAMQSKTHKVQLVGLFPAAAVKNVACEVLRLARHASNNGSSGEGANQAARRRFSAAYAYLSGDQGNPTAATTTSQTSHNGGAAPGILSLGPGGKPASAPAPAAMNPMALVTAPSRNYAPDESDTEEESGSNAESDAESQTLKAISEGEEKGKEPGRRKSQKTPRPATDGPDATARDAKKPRQDGGGEVMVRTAGNSTTATAGVEAKDAAGFLRTEEWLRQQRDNSGSDYSSGHVREERRFFHIQCSLVTPRMGQFSYATPATVSGASPPPPAPVRVGEYATLSAVEAIEEVRWSAALAPARDGAALVEVVTTTLPPARLRGGAVEPTQDSLDAAGGAKDGMVLDALNKYTIYVDNRIM